MVLVMDVARFKYPPHWLPVPAFFEAMQLVDPDTNYSRGYLLLQPTSSLKQRIMHCKTLPGKEGLCEEEEDERAQAASATNGNSAAASASHAQSKKRKLVEERIEALNGCIGSSSHGSSGSGSGEHEENGSAFSAAKPMNSFDEHEAQLQLEQQRQQQLQQHQHQQHDHLVEQRLLLHHHQDQQRQQYQQQYHSLQQQQQQQQQRIAASRNSMVDVMGGNGSSVHSLLGIHHHAQPSLDLLQSSQSHHLHQHQHQSQHHPQHIGDQQHPHIAHHMIPQQVHSSALNHMVMQSSGAGMPAEIAGMLPLQGNMNAAAAAALQMDEDVPLLFRSAAIYSNRPAKKMPVGRGSRPNNGGNTF